MNIGDFLKALFGNLKAWLAAAGVGLVVAIQTYVATVSSADADPIAALIKGAILSLIVKAVGAIVRAVTGGTAA